MVLSSDARRVSYTAHETNISVIQPMGQERQLLRTIKERQTSFTGHIIRKGELKDLIIAGKVQGKKARGGQRLLFLNQVMENTGLTSPRPIWGHSTSNEMMAHALRPRILFNFWSSKFVKIIPYAIFAHKRALPCVTSSFVCCMLFRGSGCRCDYCMFFRSVDTY